MSRYAGISQDNGLADWASKIKDMQRQVDADEEAEQKKLEEEIHASRLARVRRSRGLYGGHTNTEFTNSKESLPTFTEDKSVSEPPLDRQKGQSDALQKLVGGSSLPSRAEPISLAAFIGGRATGPRLNKHAPQQDAHDPTQFEQRARITTPHPVFGRGGVAMPGLTKTEPSSDSKVRRLSSPVATERAEAVRERSISPQKTGNRDRTLSTPTIPPSHRSESSVTPVRNSKNNSSSPVQLHHRSVSPAVTHKSPVTPTSLARVIQPDTRSLSQGLHISQSETPSPAFLRPPTQKDLTPSLSRLQGRGFVQNMVNKQLETIVSTSSTPERPASAKKSLLDRWPPEKSPPSPPKPIPVRKSRTVDGSFSPEPQKSPSIRTSLSSAATLSPPSIKSTDAPIIRPQHTPGLGSATTLVLYKPPDEELTPVDEMGRQRNVFTGKLRSEIPTTGKALNHPTRDRAKKPRKAKDKDKGSKLGVPQETFVSHSSPSPSEPTAIHPSDVDTDKGSPTENATEVTTLKDKWTKHGIIGVKSPSPSRSLTESESRPYGMIDRRALPGLVSTTITGEKSLKPLANREQTAVAFPASSPPQDFEPPPKEERWLNHPRPRIPSTGNRATVMDVAQALHSQQSQLSPEPSSSSPPLPHHPEPEVSPAIPPKPSHLKPQTTNSTIQSDRRKSSYEKYSAITLPPLKEEATPISSPAGTLSRSAGLYSSESTVGDAQTLNQDSFLQTQSERLTDIYLSPIDDALPEFEIPTLMKSRHHPDKRRDAQNISVEVISITHNGNITVTDSPNIFYDTEVLAIVHRSKSMSTGLVSTAVWGWYGKQSRLDEKEHRKLQDLARRYSTSLIDIAQYAEPLDLINVLGGQLAIRQGTRAHWSAENTAMHLVRSNLDVIFIDEHDLNVKNLCSGFSYCISVLGNVYVWHGRGSLSNERQAARKYAQGLGTNILELSQGQDDDDEMFWMVLGDENFAQADYWKWRSSSPDTQPTLWLVNSSKNEPIAPIDSLASADSVYVVDCIWELFVVVAAQARGKRKDIKLAISLATRLADHAAPKRPYTPNVHILILPSQLPIDLRLHFRNIDTVMLNSGENTPHHMHLLSVEDALDHLSRNRWAASFLKDKTMLPLGVDVSACP